MSRTVRIRIDNSPTLKVIVCEACPHWSAARFSMAEAHAVAVRHETNVHPGETQAAISASLYARRHAD